MAEDTDKYVEFECACGRIHIDDVIRKLTEERSLCDRLAHAVRAAHKIMGTPDDSPLLRDYDAARLPATTLEEH